MSLMYVYKKILLQEERVVTTSMEYDTTTYLSLKSYFRVKSYARKIMIKTWVMYKDNIDS